MEIPQFERYVPLGLKLRVDIEDGTRPLGIGRATTESSVSLDVYSVAIALLPNDQVYAGTEDYPNEPIRFVNSTMSAFGDFIRIHKSYTNDLIEMGQMSSIQFEELFVRHIGSLVVQFYRVDAHAISNREYWWPSMIDTTLRKYRRG